MPTSLIRLKSSLHSGKGKCFLEIQRTDVDSSWYFLSTNPVRRQLMRKRGARNILNPFKCQVNDLVGAVWLDEWQSFMGPAFNSLLFELLCGQAIEVIVISQSFTIDGEEKLLARFLHNVDQRYYLRRSAKGLVSCSSSSVVRGLQSFFKEAHIIEDPYILPASRDRGLLIPLDCFGNSHLLAMARNYSLVAVYLPSNSYIRTAGLWWFGGHNAPALLDSQNENQDRRYIDQKGALSGPPSHWRVFVKKWQKSFCSILWWPGWW